MSPEQGFDLGPINLTGLPESTVRPAAAAIRPQNAQTYMPFHASVTQPGTDNAERQQDILLLAHILRMPDLMAAAVDMLGEGRPLFQSDEALPLIWSAACAYWGQYQTVPPRAMVYAAVLDNISLACLSTSEYLVQKALDDLYSIPHSDLAPAYAADRITALRNQFLVQELANNLGSAAGDSTQLIREAARQLDVQSVAQPIVLDDMRNADLAAGLANVRKIPLNFSLLDEQLGGGMAKGEKALLVIPSGGGKTTLGLKLLKMSAMAGRKAGMALLEQPIQGDILLRQCVHFSGSTRSEWRPYVDACGDRAAMGQPPPRMEDYLSERTLQEYQRTITLFSRRLVLYDFAHSNSASSITGLRSIYEHVRRHDQMTGILTELLIIDWWGVLRDRIVMSMEGRFGEMAIRSRVRAELSNMAALNKEYGDIRLIMFHQLGGAASRKQGRVTAKDSQEDANLDNYFDHAFAANTADAHGRALVSHSKARSSTKQDFRWQMDGERCDIKPLNPEHGSGPLHLQRPAAAGHSGGGPADSYAL